MSRREINKAGLILKSVLSESDVNAAGLEHGQSKRLRVVTPFRLMATLVGAMGSGAVCWIADLVREFNYQNGTTVAYKAFYNRLANKGFARFMREMVSRLLTELAWRTLTPAEASPLADFEDIVIQDGSSFAVKPSLRKVFPGRFRTVEPAAVELHATYSGLEDQVIEVALTPDKEAERHCLPEAAELHKKLLLADRGYPSLPYFEAVDQAGGSFVMRISRSWKPYVIAVAQDDAAVPLSKPEPLSVFLAQRPKQVFDLDIALGRGKRRIVFRLIVLPGKEPSMTRLCTNLPRERFPVELVGRLYRFRWQVELCFKEWKSHANLHAFDTGNPHIAEGLIWAALATAIIKRFIAHAAQAIGVVAISTQRVASCARHFLRNLMITLIHSPKRFNIVLDAAIGFLLHNARRAHPKRDRRKGRQNAGLLLVGGGLK